MHPRKITQERIDAFGVKYSCRDGNEVVLLYTHSAMIKAEKAGMEIGGLHERQALMLWALLLPAQPSATLDDACYMIDLESAHKRSEQLWDAVLEARAKGMGLSVDELRAKLGLAEEVAPANPPQPAAEA